MLWGSNVSVWEERKGKREDLNVSPLSFSIFVGKEKGELKRMAKNTAIKMTHQNKYPSVWKRRREQALGSEEKKRKERKKQKEKGKGESLITQAIYVNEEVSEKGSWESQVKLVGGGK